MSYEVTDNTLARHVSKVSRYLQSASNHGHVVWFKKPLLARET